MTTRTHTLRSTRRRKAPMALATLTAAILAAAPLQASAEPVTAEAASSTIGIFSDSAPTDFNRYDDARPVEIGMRFSAKVEGSVTGVQVYKASASRSATPATGTLWNSQGQPLATAEFDASSGSGWVSVDFDTPVQLRPGSEYTVSAFVPSGTYAATGGEFKTTTTTEYLSAYKGSNGVFRYGTTSAHPTSSFNSTNYWVDLEFVPATGVGTPSQPTRPTKPAPEPEPAPPTRPTKPAPEPTTPPSGGSAQDGFPTADNTGVPDGWTPKKSITGDHVVNTPGAVVEDLRITNGSIVVNAPDVTIRRVELLGGKIDNFRGKTCETGLVVEDTSILRSPDRGTNARDAAAIGVGGYTARNVKIDGHPEGFRVGGKYDGCGSVTIENSYAHITPPDVCQDWHGDGIQGYDGDRLTVRNVTLKMTQTRSCGGTAPFFYPHSQGNTSVDIDGLLVEGGGYPFRLGTPGTVKNLNVVDKSWNFGPIDVKCSALTAWDAAIVTLDANGQPATSKKQTCNTETGN